MKVEGNKNPSDKNEFSCDPIVKSITSDLALLGNALMTRINDPLTILEFISFDALKKNDMKDQIKGLIDSFVSCDNDDDRLRYLLEMHFILAHGEFGKVTSFKKVFEKLQDHLIHAKKNQGHELKKAVSKFQVEVLQIIPGITKPEYEELAKDLLDLDHANDLNETINTVYEKINMHTQTPFLD
jgi:DNA repair ATPase RecN